MRSTEFRLGIAFATLALAALLLVPTISNEWRRSTIAGDQFFTLGPRFFPFVAVALMGLFSALLIVSNRRTASRDEPRRPLRAVVAFFVIGAAYVAAFPFWGLLATPFCLGALFFYFGVRRWTTLVLVPIVTTVLMVICFEHVMRIPLP
ncbi:MAG: hypothetical protein GEU99_19155 [Luteitalea sp.]|nr:hypothetical protein [Luteitalea sp.]